MHCVLYYVHVSYLIQYCRLHKEDDCERKFSRTHTPVENIASNSNSTQVMVFCGYCIGQIITPQFFIAKESPTYPMGFRAYFVTASMMIAIEAGLMLYLLIENKRRDKRALEAGDSQNSSGHRIVESDLMDLTDWERSNFRYSW